MAFALGFILQSDRPSKPSGLGRRSVRSLPLITVSKQQGPSTQPARYISLSTRPSSFLFLLLPLLLLIRPHRPKRHSDPQAAPPAAHQHLSLRVLALRPFCRRRRRFQLRRRDDEAAREPAAPARPPPRVGRRVVGPVAEVAGLGPVARGVPGRGRGRGDGGARRDVGRVVVVVEKEGAVVSGAQGGLGEGAVGGGDGVDGGACRGGW